VGPFTTGEKEEWQCPDRSMSTIEERSMRRGNAPRRLAPPIFGRESTVEQTRLRCRTRTFANVKRVTPPRKGKMPRVKTKINTRRKAQSRGARREVLTFSKTRDCRRHAGGGAMGSQESRGGRIRNERRPKWDRPSGGRTTVPTELAGKFRRKETSTFEITSLRKEKNLVKRNHLASQTEKRF